MILQPVFPTKSSTQVSAVTAVSAQLINFPKDVKQYIITNVGSQLIFVRITETTDTSAATTSDFPILPNSQVVLSRGIDSTRVAFIAAGVGSSIYVTAGEGLTI